MFIFTKKKFNKLKSFIKDVDEALSDNEQRVNEIDEVLTERSESIVNIDERVTKLEEHPTQTNSMVEAMRETFNKAIAKLSQDVVRVAEQVKETRDGRDIASMEWRKEQIVKLSALGEQFCDRDGELTRRLHAAEINITNLIDRANDLEAKQAWDTVIRNLNSLEGCYNHLVQRMTALEERGSASTTHDPTRACGNPHCKGIAMRGRVYCQGDSCPVTRD